MSKKNNHFDLKIYVDTCIISRMLDGRCNQDDLNAIARITEYKEFLFTSEKTKREIDQYENQTGKMQLNAIYNLLKKIPEKNVIKTIPAMFNAIMFNEATFNGSAHREDPLFSALKAIFDKDDSEHIFQAEKNELDFFLTLDKKTVLNRAISMKDKLEGANVKLRFVSPQDLASILTSTVRY